MSAGSRRGATAPHTGTRAPSAECRRALAQRRDLRVRQVRQREPTPRRSSVPGSGCSRFTLGSARLASAARRRAAHCRSSCSARRPAAIRRSAVRRRCRVAEHGGRRAVDDHVRARNHVAVAQQPVFGDERQLDALARCQPHRPVAASYRSPVSRRSAKPGRSIRSRRRMQQVELPAAIGDRLGPRFCRIRRPVAQAAPSAPRSAHGTPAAAA